MYFKVTLTIVTAEGLKSEPGLILGVPEAAACNNRVLKASKLSLLQAAEPCPTPMNEQTVQCMPLLGSIYAENSRTSERKAILDDSNREPWPGNQFPDLSQRTNPEPLEGSKRHIVVQRSLC